MNIEEIILRIGNRKIVCFHGEMGAGKTTMIKQIVEHLGTEDIVNSPTFSIVNEYNLLGGERVYHMDLYRIKNVEELIGLGFEDYLHSGDMCLIEWPEIAEDLLPEEVCHVHIKVDEKGGRDVTIS